MANEIDAASARGVSDGWKESLCYDQAGGTGQFELNDPEPDNHHSALYLQDPNGALFNISCDNREGLDIKRGQWMVAVLNAALSAAPSSPAASPEVERLRSALSAVRMAAAFLRFSNPEEEIDNGLADIIGIVKDALRTPLAPAGEEAPILKGIGKINGDGWKDTTRKGEIVFVWGRELPSPYSPGQYPRVGNGTWSATAEQYDFAPATADEIRTLFASERTTGFIAGRDAAAGHLDAKANEMRGTVTGDMMARIFEEQATAIRAIEPGEMGE